MRKRITALFITVVLCMATAIPAFAAERVSDIISLSEEAPQRLVDGADLLYQEEENELASKLDEISLRQDCDIVIVTVNGLDGYTPMEYADDYYDYNGYADDGILLLISMEERDWYISTKGYGITAVTDAGLDYMSEKFLDDLSDGDYNSAFNTYADLCDDFITQAKEGEPYDSGNLPKEPLSLIWIPIAIVIGLIFGLIVTGIMVAKLKTVRKQAAASNYIKDGSLKITDAREIFLYHHISRTPRPKSSSSGSSTHTSSSGSTHGGGGGKF